VEIKVGILHNNREIVVETTESSSDVQAAFEKARVSADGLLTLTDERGRKVMIAASAIAYLDIGQENARHVGFGTG
jgi:Protein of unknown function (DUF3107)